MVIDDVELFLDLVLPPKEFDFPEVGVVILLREIPPVLEEEEFCVSDLGSFPGEGGTTGGSYTCVDVGKGKTVTEVCVI